MTGSDDVTQKTTEQNLIVCIGKSEPKYYSLIIKDFARGVEVLYCWS